MSNENKCKGLGCTCVVVRSLPVDGTCIPKTGEINSEQIDCKPMTGESIPGVDCIGKVVELGSTGLRDTASGRNQLLHVVAP